MFRCVCVFGFYDFFLNRVIEWDGCFGELMLNILIKGLK